jgi:sortase family protein
LRLARRRAQMRRYWRAMLGASLVLAAAVPLVWEATRPPALAGSRPVSGMAATASPDPAAVGTAPVSPSPPHVPRKPSSIFDLQIVAPIPPVSLRAPRVGIEAAVDPVGIEAGTAGVMEIPDDIGRAGWYRYGPAPGDPEGVAVITSHVDSARYGPGAFFRLRELEPGDQVTVDLADGRALTYQVVGREQMAKDALPTAELFRRDGAPALALVTCGGAFNRSAGSYADNVIVWAVPVSG